MNRTLLPILGILGGLLLAMILIYTANPTIRPPKLEFTPTIPSSTPRAPITHPPETKNRAQQKNEAPNQTLPPPKPVPIATQHTSEDAPVEISSARDVHIVVQSHARWGPVLGIIGQSDDSVSHSLTLRIQEMRREMMTMRRDPEAINMEHLVEQQRMILSELRQIPSWGEELEKTAAQVESVLNQVGTE